MEMRWRVSRGFLTHTDTVTNVFALPCCHNQDIPNYHRFRLEAVSVFDADTVLQMKSWGTANEQNNTLMIVYTVETWSNFGWLSGQCLPMTPLLVYRPRQRGKKRVIENKAETAEPIIFYSLHKWHFNKRKFSLLLHYTVLDLCLADW